MKPTKEWQKEVEWANISIHNLYPDGKVPDDINQFLKDIYNKGVNLGKQCSHITYDDIKELRKEMESLRDQISDEFSRFDDNLEFYIKQLDKTPKEGV